MRAHTPSLPDDTHRALHAAVIAVAALLQLVVLVPFTVSSGLVAPVWAIGGLLLLWAAGAGLLVRLARTRPLATPLVPLGNAAVLWAAITLGEQVLGWTA
jgi:hypothetical protein